MTAKLFVKQNEFLKTFFHKDFYSSTNKKLYKSYHRITLIVRLKVISLLKINVSIKQWIKNSCTSKNQFSQKVLLLVPFDPLSRRVIFFIFHRFQYCILAFLIQKYCQLLQILIYYVPPEKYQLIRFLKQSILCLLRNYQLFCHKQNKIVLFKETYSQYEPHTTVIFLPEKIIWRLFSMS